jgi:hypothetical protein
MLKCYIGSMRWILLIVAGLSVGCTSNTTPTITPSATSIPATITLNATVSSGPAPAGSIEAIVRDVSGLVVVGVTVSFSSSVGFITTPAQTGSAGAAEAILSNVPAGSAATVTASVPVSGTTTPVTASTIVHF